MIAACIVATIPAEAAQNLWTAGSPGKTVNVAPGETVGYRFRATAAFTQTKVHIMTGGAAHAGGACEVSLYAWDTDYATTIESEPLKTAANTNLPDGTTVGAEGLNAVDQFLGQGEYLVTVRNTTDAVHATAKVGVQGKNNGDTAIGFSYLDGVESQNHDAKVHLFVVSADEVFGTCEPSVAPETEPEVTEPEVTESEVTEPENTGGGDLFEDDEEEKSSCSGVAGTGAVFLAFLMIVTATVVVVPVGGGRA